MKKLLLLPVFLFALISSPSAQETMTLEEQITHLIQKSNRWEDFKVVKIKSLEQLQTNITDSINALKIDAAEARASVASFEEEKAALLSEITKRDAEISELYKEKESITFLGLPVEKAIYKNIMWGISGALLVLLLIFVFRFKRSNVITVQARAMLSEIQEEYNSYKKRALEKEQKLARELQNELNKRMC
jgi:preprotein translocase subunit SecF